VKKLVKVALDSNFLMLPTVKRINLISELDRLINFNYKLITPSCVVDELKRLVDHGKPLERRRARFALKLLEELGVEVEGEPSFKAVDEALLQGALHHGWLVATNDSELRRKLRDRGVPVIYLRGGKKLVMEGEVDWSSYDEKL